MTAPVKILVTGGNGQLASELKELAGNYTNVSFVFFDRSELSISDHNELEKYLKFISRSILLIAPHIRQLIKQKRKKKLLLPSTELRWVQLLNYVNPIIVS